MLKKTPPALLVGIGVGLVFYLAQIVRAIWLKEASFEGVSWILAENGISFVVPVLGLAGVLELRQRLTGTRALGALIAAIGFGVSIALAVGWIAWGYYVSTTHFDDFPVTGWYALSTIQSAATIAVCAGLGLASGRRALAVIGAGAALIADPPWFVVKWIYEGHDMSVMLQLVIQSIPMVAKCVVLLVFAGIASREVELASDPVAASSGFQMAAQALWIRVVAALIALMVVLMMASAVHGGSSGLYDLIQGAVMVGLVVNALSLGLFTRGVLRAARWAVPDLDRWRLVIGAAASIWLMGVLVARLPWQYALIKGNAESYMFDMKTQFATSLEVTGQLVGIAGIALVLTAIASLARRRNLEHLRENAAVRAGSFVMLMIGSVAVPHLVAEHAQTNGAGVVVFVMLAAAAAAFYGVVIAAKLCGEAGKVIESDPGLPSAKIMQ